MPTPLASRPAFWSVVVLFFYNGFGMGAYAGGLATTKARVGATDWRMSLVFIVTGVAAITAMQVCGRLADRYGARRVALAAIVPAILAELALAGASSYPALLAAVVVCGLGNGSLDVTMNVLAVGVEKAGGRPVMSFFHGTWSVGSMAGAAAVAAVGRLSGWSPTRTLVTVFLGIAVVGVAVWFVARRITPETEPVHHVTASGEKAPIPPLAYLFGLMAVAAGIGEGVGSDWSAIHAETVAGVSPTTAALAYTAMASAMLAVRLVGDLIVTRIGRRATVFWGAFAAMAGYLVAALATPFPLLLVGWALVGLGCGNVFPQVYGAAGHAAGGRGLAVVVTFGYATFLISPALMGTVITAIGIRPTMFVPAALLVGLVLLSRILPGREEELSLGKAV